MATQNPGTSEREQQSQGKMARGSQQALTRRAGSEPLALSPFQLFRMNPFSLMRRMTEEMDRVFGDFGAGRAGGEPSMWWPAMEAYEREGAYVVHAELPGLKPDDVKVEIAGDELIIQGERSSEREQEDRRMHMTERQYGRFYRAIPLPEGAKAEDVRANFEHGVLEITVPLDASKTNRKQIPVQAGQAAAGQAAGAGQTAQAAQAAQAGQGPQSAQPPGSSQSTNKAA